MDELALCFQKNSLPKFLIRGHLDATNCVISLPLTGEVVVENSDVPIKSIELQLVRVETCGKCTLWGNQSNFHWARSKVLWASAVFRLRWGLRQRRHRDPEHPDSWRWRLPQPRHPHLYDLPQTVHLPHAGDNKLQSRSVKSIPVILTQTIYSKAHFSFLFTRFTG